jgi:hypothetical protein
MNESMNEFGVAGWIIDSVSTVFMENCLFLDYVSANYDASFQPLDTLLYRLLSEI